MNALRKYLEQIQGQLKALNVSQKLLIGLLGLILVAAVSFTVLWSAKPQMVSLTAQPLTAQEISAIEIVLKGAKHEYQVAGNKILVPVEQRQSITGLLYAERAMPKGASAFAELIAANNIFTPEAQNSRMWNTALQTELTRILLNFPYVDDANVILTTGQQAGLGRAGSPPQASVYVKTRPNEDMSNDRVLAIVEMITGTVSGMKRENVNLVVNGQRSYHAPSADIGATPADLVQYKKLVEDYLSAKLFNQFSSYGDVKIAVNVMPDLSLRHRNDLIVNPQNKVVVAESEQSRETTQRDGATAGGEPGSKSNDAMSVTDASGGGRGGSSSSTENNTKNVVKIGEQRIETMLPPGVEIKELTANLLFPRSYFVSLFRRQTGDAKAEPDDAKLQPLVDAQLKSAVASAKNVIGAKADEQIRADLYDDLLMLHGGGPEIVLAATGGLGGAKGGMMPMIAQYAKQGVLTIVALSVLGMMLMMVRRAVPAGVGDEMEGGGGMLGGFGAVLSGGKSKKRGSSVEQLDATDDVFGEANQGEAVLTGIELDDETLASRKMVDEVSTMIKENPENAASLVKRWMSKSN